MITCYSGPPSSRQTRADDLRRMIDMDCGEDAQTEPAFAWSTVLPCERCGREREATAVVSFDGELFERLCSLCYFEGPAGEGGPISCPTAARAPDGTPHAIIGCGSDRVVEDASEPGLYDCLDCGLWFRPAEESVR